MLLSSHQGPPFLANVLPATLKARGTSTRSLFFLESNGMDVGVFENASGRLYGVLTAGCVARHIEFGKEVGFGGGGLGVSGK